MIMGKEIIAQLLPISLTVILLVNNATLCTLAVDSQDLLGTIQVYDESTTLKELVLNK